MELPYDPAIPLLRIKQKKKKKNTSAKEYVHSYVHCCVIYNNQELATTQVPISRWVDKKAVENLYKGLYAS